MKKLFATLNLLFVAVGCSSGRGHHVSAPPAPLSAISPVMQPGAASQPADRTAPRDDALFGRPDVDYDTCQKACGRDVTNPPDMCFEGARKCELVLAKVDGETIYVNEMRGVQFDSNYNASVSPCMGNGCNPGRDRTSQIYGLSGRATPMIPPSLRGSLRDNYFPYRSNAFNTMPDLRSGYCHGRPADQGRCDEPQTMDMGRTRTLNHLDDMTHCIEQGRPQEALRIGYVVREDMNHYGASQKQKDSMGSILGDLGNAAKSWGYAYARGIEEQIYRATGHLAASVNYSRYQTQCDMPCVTDACYSACD